MAGSAAIRQSGSDDLVDCNIARAVARDRALSLSPGELSLKQLTTRDGSNGMDRG